VSEDYFTRIRARPYDAAAARSRMARQLDLGQTPIPDVATGVAMGPVDAIDTMTRKIGSGLNAGIAAVTGGGSGMYGQPMKAFADLESGRVLPNVETKTLPGNVARGITTFLTLYGPATQMLGGGGVVGEMAAGALADMLAFENKTGTLSDAARALGFDNELTRALSGELADDEWEASLRAAVEGAGLGALAPAYRALRRAAQEFPDAVEALKTRLQPAEEAK
jgi:hypothetical protein